ncbi:MAG: hypothetical protein WD295_05345 [Bacteroidota bacterium]
MKSLLRIFVFLGLFPVSLSAQNLVPRDTTIVFEPSQPLINPSASYSAPRNAWGFDIMLSNNGFGGGGFFRREVTDELSWFITLAVSDVKDDAEVEYYTYWGQSFVPGKKNRLLMVPLVAGVQYRLFKDDIMDNFRPYISAGIGPSMMFVSPYSVTKTYDIPGGGTMSTTEQIEFFSSLKQGRARFTVGGYIGAGAYFGLDRGTLSGLSVRYYYVPFIKGIEILEDRLAVKEFGGFYITLNFGSLF